MLSIVNDRIQESKEDTKEKPDVVILLDESGSMALHQESVVSTFNEYIAKVRADVNTISLYTFDSTGIREKMYMVNIKDVKPLTVEDYSPNAMTPLYDAMGIVMSKFKGNERNVQFVTHTDGQNNQSVEWNHESIKHYISNFEKNDGWMFVYLGEGLTAQDTLKDFSGLKMNFDAHTRSIAIDALGTTTQLYSTTGVGDAKAYTADGSDTIQIDSSTSVEITAQKEDKEVPLNQ